MSSIGECCAYWIFGCDPPDSNALLARQALFERGAPLRPLRPLASAAAFLIGAPWLLRWWGVRRYLAAFLYFVVEGKTFELDYGGLLSAHRRAIRGVVHVGASLAQEAPLYKQLGIAPVLWLEAQPSLQPVIVQKLRDLGLGDKEHKVLQAACWHTSGEQLTMHITNNSLSSSLLALGKGHRTYFPFIKETGGGGAGGGPVTVTTTTLDDIFSKHPGLSPQDYNFMYLDVQGAELPVLQGSQQLLAHIDFIMSEVSSEEHYVGGTLVPELDAFLQARGFGRSETCMTPLGHGNALYVRRGRDAAAS